MLSWIMIGSSRQVPGSQVDMSREPAQRIKPTLEFELRADSLHVEPAENDPEAIHSSHAEAYLSAVVVDDAWCAGDDSACRPEQHNQPTRCNRGWSLCTYYLTVREKWDGMGWEERWAALLVQEKAVWSLLPVCMLGDFTWRQGGRVWMWGAEFLGGASVRREYGDGHTLGCYPGEANKQAICLHA